MRIIFDLRNVGLGNNGGSSTIIKSANTLIDLGCDVFVVDSGRNQHTWTELKATHKIVKNDKDLPSADIIIATGYKSVSRTVNAPAKCGIKSHYIRGWETWQMPEKKIVSKILKAPTTKFVNSICLQNKLKKYGVDSYLVRPGYDFDDLYPTGARLNRDKYIMGALYTTGKHVDIKRYKWVVAAATYMKRNYENVELWLMGVANRPSICDKYYRQPKMEQKNEFYNGVDVWLSPSKQEGLHMPPAEAMMTECPVIGNASELNGTDDYLIDKQTGLISKDDYLDFRNCIEKLYFNRVVRINLGQNAKMRVSKIGSREDNMKQFIDLIGTLK